MKRKTVKKVLAFGGGFDPVHKGHLALLKAAMAQIKPDKILVVPSPDTPSHKESFLFPAAKRVQWLRDCLPSGVEIFDWEIHRPGKNYAWKTVQRLHHFYPRSRLYYLLGSDNWNSIHTWSQPWRLKNDEQLVLVVGTRAGISGRATEPDRGFSRVLRLKEKFPAVSSSEIRRRLLEEGESARGLLKKLVPSCILRRVLGPETFYLRLHAYLKSKLPPRRYEHTLAVARLAAELAQIHGLDASRASLAALLHDASRTTEDFSNSHQALGHAGRSAQIARRIFGLKDRQVLEAVALHTTGGPSMGPLARLVYTADFSSYDREFGEAQKVRVLARKNLKTAFYESVKNKILYLKRAGLKPHPASLKLFSRLERMRKK